MSTMKCLRMKMFGICQSNKVANVCKKTCDICDDGEETVPGSCFSSAKVKAIVASKHFCEKCDRPTLAASFSVMRNKYCYPKKCTITGTNTVFVTSMTTNHIRVKPTG